MKKLLLALVPVMLFFGVSFGYTETYTISHGALSAITSHQEGHQQFISNGISQLISIARLDGDCPNRFISMSGSGTNYQIGAAGNVIGTIIATGSFVGNTGTMSLNLTGNQLYRVGIYSGNGAGNGTFTGAYVGMPNCVAGRDTSSTNFWLSKGFLSFPLRGYFFASNGVSLLASALNVVSSMTFSGNTVFGPPTNPTIYYNGTLTTGGTSNIYLNGITSTPSYSGGMIVFTYLQNIFRALFRSH